MKASRLAAPAVTVREAEPVLPLASLATTVVVSATVSLALRLRAPALSALVASPKVPSRLLSKIT